MSILSPWYYRNVSSTENPIIKEISYSVIDDIMGNKVYESYAFLNENIGLSKKPKDFIFYGNADGTGTAPNLIDATYKAISEAIERWAFLHTFYNASTQTKYGFDLDKSTSGMAAYPELIAHNVKYNARNEAIERWAIQMWWIGLISHESIDPFHNLFKIVLITSPFKTYVAILHTVIPTNGLRAYGFAGASTSKDAIRKATIELCRNCKALSSPTALLSHPTNLIEQRLFFFAQSEGQRLFDARVKAIVRPQTLKPIFYFDGNLPGPWNKYAKVWRTVLDYGKVNPNTVLLEHFLF